MVVLDLWQQPFYLLEQPMRACRNRTWTPRHTADEKKPLPEERLVGNG
jgi:hypothetical protein